MTRILYLATLLFTLTSCHADSIAQNDEQLQWADSTMWFEGQKRLGSVDCSRPDVFYLLPTCLFAWQDDSGNTHYNADPTQPSHRQAWTLSAQLADTVFATRANLFLPYYRQCTFETFSDMDATLRQEAIDTATRDVEDAFDYYIRHLNNGRPFILAGYSQGAMMAVRLLRHMSDDAYQRMVAAYVVGYGITEADTVRGTNRLQHIRPATDSVSTGVTVCLNSVTDTSAVNPVLCGGNIACINPVSWTTTDSPAVLLPAGAEPQADDPRFGYATAVKPAVEGAEVTVSANPERHVLVVSGVDADRYYLPAFSYLFPKGNLHLQELFFYGDLLRRNVLLRQSKMGW